MLQMTFVMVCPITICFSTPIRKKLKPHPNKSVFKSGMRYSIDSGKIFIQIFIVAGHGDHGSIVHRIFKAWDMYLPVEFVSCLMKGFFQSGIGGYTAGYPYFPDACLLACLDQLIHQDINNGILK